MKINQEVYGKEGGNEDFDAHEMDRGHERDSKREHNHEPKLVDTYGGVSENLRKMLGMN